MNSEITVFDRERKIKQLDRAAKKFNYSDFLHVEAANRLADQFGGVIVKKFDNVLNIGARTGYLSEMVKQNLAIKNLVETDISLNFLQNSKTNNFKVLANEEFLPFKDESFDLIVSNLALHWVNDLPGSLIQIKRILKKGGFFCANIFGSKTLHELRHAMILAEADQGTSPRVSPFIDVRDGAGLLQRAGFNEPVSVAEDIVVKYNFVKEILRDLQNTGETNSLIKLNRKFPGKKFFDKVEETYQQNFGDELGHLNATFEIITLSGWKS